MRYYDENTNKILTKTGVKKALYNVTLPKYFTLDNLIGTSIKEFIETPKPEITSLQLIENGGVNKVNNKYYQVWNVIDRFQDISGGLTKEEQETNFIELENERLLNIKLKELAALRFEKETSGINVNGNLIKTDLESQSKINGAYNTMQINPDLLINWKGENGWVQLTYDDVIVISNAVSVHVQSCYTREKELSDALNIDIDTDITLGWPE